MFYTGRIDTVEVGFTFKTIISVVVSASCVSVYGKMVLQTKDPFLKDEDA